MTHPDSSRTQVTVELSGEALVLLRVRQDRAGRMAGGEVTLAEAARQVLEEHLLGCNRKD